MNQSRITSTELPFITVGIFTHNRAQYINYSINSVLRQDYDNYEIVIVDDNSSDNTEQVVKTIQSNKIKYRRSDTHLGRPGARNLLIREAVGEYILWLGDDDILEQGILSVYAKIIIENNHIDIIYGNVQAFDDLTGKDLEFYDPNDYTNSNKYILLNLIKGSGITDGASLIRKSIYQKYGNYDVEYCRAQDNEFWSRIALNVNFYKLDRTVFRYRRHTSNASFGNLIDTSYESLTIRRVLSRYQLNEIFPDTDFKSPQESSEAFLTAALGLIRFGDYYNALEIIKKHCKINDLKVFRNSILCELYTGNHNKARTQFEELKSLFPSDLKELIELNVSIQDFEQIEAMLLKINITDNKQIITNYVVPFYRKYGLTFRIANYFGQFYSSINNYEEAFKFYCVSTRMNPEDANNYSEANKISRLLIKQNELQSIRNRILTKMPIVAHSPLISVIVPTYNRKNLLERCLNSILSQSYKNFEILVINDCGEDISCVLEKYNDKRIKYLEHKQNCGVSAARNTGLHSASGKYISYLDDDDVYLPDHLEILVNFLEQSNKKVAYTDAYRLNEKDNSKSLPYSVDFDKNKLLLDNFIPILCVMHEKSCLFDSGYFDESLTVFEDWELWIRISRKYDFAHIKKVTCEFRWSEEGSTITSSKWDEFCWTSLILFNRSREIAQESALLNERISEFIAYHENSVIRILNYKHSESEQIVRIFLELANYYVDKKRITSAIILFYRISLQYPAVFLESGKFLKDLFYKFSSLTGFTRNLTNKLSESLEQLYFSLAETKISQLTKVKSTLISSHTPNKQFDILIPVYNAYEQVIICLESVLHNTSPQHKIFLLDDCSTDERVLPMLRKYAAQHNHITVVHHQNNLGFVKNINYGLNISSRDVVLLNSDTQVTSGWLIKMEECLISRPGIGIVSPLSNNATILSVPKFNENNKIPEDIGIEKFALLVERYSEQKYPAIPTAVGFCMLITRKTINTIGYFDEAFGLGYGEENDFCMRALNANIESVCCDDAYVNHFGESSFKIVEEIGSKKLANTRLLKKKWPEYENMVLAFCLTNPLRYLQEKLQVEIERMQGRNNTKVLEVIHSYGVLGGTELHTKKMVERLANKFDITILFPYPEPHFYFDMYPFEVDGYKVVKYNSLFLDTTKNGKFIQFSELNTNPITEKFFSDFLLGGEYQIVHFQHLGNWGSFFFPIIAKYLGKKVVISIHDYFLWCPEYNLINEANKKCGKNKASYNDPECIKCLSAKRICNENTEELDISSYLLERELLCEKILQIADSVIVPSAFVKQKVIATFGLETENKISIYAHGIDQIGKSSIQAKVIQDIFRVAFIGNLNERKGGDVFIKTAELLKNEKVEFKVCGGVSKSYKDKISKLNIITTGEFNIENLGKLLDDIDLVVIPSILDETYCLTVDEAMSLGVPVIASSAGAISERIKHGINGFLVTCYDPSAFASQILELSKNPGKLIHIRKHLQKIHFKTLEENANDYEYLYNHLKHNPATVIPRVSIIIPLYNAAGYTKECINSVSAYTKCQYEIILVDNASTDDTFEYLKSLSNQNNIKVIVNQENKGFPFAVNQGILQAKSALILIANNDILVTDGWLTRMIELFESDTQIGIVGPVSNYISGPQMDREAIYKDLADMHEYARNNKNTKKGTFEIFPRVAFLCTLIRKEVIEQIGGLDERFSPGNFEDDDFCLRAQLAGYKTVIAKDVFIHHYGSKSFKANGDKVYDDLIERNRKKFINKWGADPEEIWIQGKSVIKRNLKYPIHDDKFIQSFERALIHIDDNEYQLADLELNNAISAYHSSERKDYNIEYSDVIELRQKINTLIQSNSNPDIQRLLNDLDELMNAGELEKAQKIIESIFEIDHNNLVALNNQAFIKIHKKEYELALQILEQILKRDPNNEIALNNLQYLNETI